ncbi:hypothetical protein B0T16DRAFT_206949 [Cercophora newfieldiana]|uniref:Uncharacterized protein n=1 Tax=Cercophora newfieldiana TaxID=92897 RepID=A0AA39XVL4_9PEZI|nr:hypothetical protein B0T16DRAFT_206949 [Cercophora newfieldiana]
MRVQLPWCWASVVVRVSCSGRDQTLRPAFSKAGSHAGMSAEFRAYPASQSGWMTGDGIAASHTLRTLRCCPVLLPRAAWRKPLTPITSEMLLGTSPESLGPTEHVRTSLSWLSSGRTAFRLIPYSRRLTDLPPRSIPLTAERI